MSTQMITVSPSVQIYISRLTKSQSLCENYSEPLLTEFLHRDWVLHNFFPFGCGAYHADSTAVPPSNDRERHYVYSNYWRSALTNMSPFSLFGYTRQISAIRLQRTLPHYLNYCRFEPSPPPKSFCAVDERAGAASGIMISVSYEALVSSWVNNLSWTEYGSFVCRRLESGTSKWANNFFRTFHVMLQYEHFTFKPEEY